MSVFLEGISAQFYRGIGAERQYVSAFGDINFFIGNNNAGKSIALNLICNHSSPDGVASKSLQTSEVHRGKEEGQFKVEIGLNVTRVKDAITKKINEQFLNNNSERRRLTEWSRLILDHIAEDGFVWCSYERKQLVASILSEDGVNSLKAILDPEHWRKLDHLLGGSYGGGGLERNWIPNVLSILISAVGYDLPERLMVPAKRQLGGKGEAFSDLSGKGLIDHLAGLQAPDFHEQHKRDEFHKINLFLREVTGKDDAKLEVPSERNHLLVHMDNKVLPLEALGTGIHETVLIASFCTINKKKILCIEEPEIHLHPVLQRKLVRYLAEKTDNQYFIATHSAALIDYEGASIFHVSNDGDQTRIDQVIGEASRHGLLDELGYRASDILQTNFVIWVEGPSDRIYLRHWLNEAAPELSEGIDFTIMFYGGGLIKHLSASEEGYEESIGDFIKVLKLNRNCAIVLDSDRESSEAPLKNNAARIQKEMNAAGRMAWITAGREVENYIDHNELQDALKSCHPRLYSKPHSGGQFDHAFYFFTKKEENGRHIVYKNGDKVGAAIKVCESVADLSKLDLKEKVGGLVNRIRKANGV